MTRYVQSNPDKSWFPSEEQSNLFYWGFEGDEGTAAAWLIFDHLGNWIQVLLYAQNPYNPYDYTRPPLAKEYFQGRDTDEREEKAFTWATRLVETPMTLLTDLL